MFMTLDIIPSENQFRNMFSPICIYHVCVFEIRKMYKSHWRKPITDRSAGDTSVPYVYIYIYTHTHMEHSPVVHRFVNTDIARDLSNKI